MPYVIIDPVKKTYDGGYTYKADAEAVATWAREAYAAPEIFVTYIAGIASSTLEPHFRWMADVEIFNK